MTVKHKTNLAGGKKGDNFPSGKMFAMLLLQTSMPTGSPWLKTWRDFPNVLAGESFLADFLRLLANPPPPPPTPRP